MLTLYSQVAKNSQHCDEKFKAMTALHYKVTVLLENIDLRSYVQQFEHSLTALLEIIDLLLDK